MVLVDAPCNYFAPQAPAPILKRGRKLHHHSSAHSEFNWNAFEGIDGGIYD